MATALGSIAVSARWGSSQYPQKLYLGDEVVAATVPGAPTITNVTHSNSFNLISFLVPPNGGSEITQYKIFVAGVGASTAFAQISGNGTFGQISQLGSAGIPYQISAVNAIGEGPRSNPVIAT